MDDLSGDIATLPKEFIMPLATDATVQVLWAFAIALAKTTPQSKSFVDELLRQLDTVGRQFSEAPEDNKAAHVWNRLFQVQASDLLEAAGATIEDVESRES